MVILSSRLRENGMNVAICTSDSRLLSFSSDSWCPFSQLKYLPHLPLLGPFDIFSVKYTRANYLSNCRESTLEFVERVGLSTLVDIVVCGDDQVRKLKNVECRHVRVCGGDQWSMTRLESPNEICQNSSSLGFCLKARPP